MTETVEKVKPNYVKVCDGNIPLRSVSRKVVVTDEQIDYSSKVMNVEPQLMSGETIHLQSHLQANTTTFSNTFSQKVLVVSPHKNLLEMFGKDGGSLLRIQDDGNFYVKDKLVENDIQVVDTLREFLIDHGYSWLKK